jgi:periplasmic protein CpxP/Spy
MRIGFSVTSRGAMTALLAAAILGVTAQAAPAQQQTGGSPVRSHGGRGLAGRGPVMGANSEGRVLLRSLRRLHLTDAQQAQIKGMLMGHRDELKAVARELATARGALRKASAADAPDEAAVRVAAATLADREARAALLRAKVRAEVLAVLTPEQRQTVKAMRERASRRARAVRDRVLD